MSGSSDPVREAGLKLSDMGCGAVEGIEPVEYDYVADGGDRMTRIRLEVVNTAKQSYDYANDCNFDSQLPCPGHKMTEIRKRRCTW